MASSKKEITGTVVALGDGKFWYKACINCHSKFLECHMGCVKCGCLQEVIRYRISFEVDTNCGLLSICTFGNTLTKFFGASASSISSLAQTPNMSTKLNDAVENCFIGGTFVFIIKNWNKKSTCHTALIAEDCVPISTANQTQSIADYLEMNVLNCDHLYCDSLSSNLSTTETTVTRNIDNSILKDTSQSINIGLTSRHSLSPKHARSKSDSLQFLEDSLMVSLLKNHNLTIQTPPGKCYCVGNTPDDVNWSSSGGQPTDKEQSSTSCEILDDVTLPLTSQEKLGVMTIFEEEGELYKLKSNSSAKSKPSLEKLNASKLLFKQLPHNHCDSSKFNISTLNNDVNHCSMFHMPRCFSTPKRVNVKCLSFNDVGGQLDSPELFGNTSGNFSTDIATSNTYLPCNQSLDLFL